MLYVLTHNILPVFAMLALGFLLGRLRTASLDEAKAVNRVAFLVLQPPLIFMLLTGLDLASVSWDAIAIYALCEVLILVATFAIARSVLTCDVAEAFLLGMAVTFVNSLLYLWPIATLIYGEAGAIPISAIVALDASVFFAFFIVGMEVITHQSVNRAALKRIALNPIILTIVLSLLLNVLAVTIPKPVATAARFAGAGAAPMTLFALGVVLSHHQLRPNATITTVSAMKLIVFPITVSAAFALVSPENAWRDLFVLNAAGPSGAMAFSLALLYGVRAANIAPVIIWTSVLSLLSLSWLA